MAKEAAEVDSSGDPYVMVNDVAPSEAAHIYSRFFHGRKESTYSSNRVKKIETRRSHPDLEGRLFYDELLSLALLERSDENEAIEAHHLHPSNFYPPAPGTPDSIIALIEVIQSSSFDRIKKLALWYYLILDLDAQSGEKTALDFAKQAGLPRSARYAMTGYWLLDQGDYPIAISYLTEQPDFVAKILRAISPLPYTSTNREETGKRALALSQFLSLVPVEELGVERDDNFEQVCIIATCWAQGIRAAWVQAKSIVSRRALEKDDYLLSTCVGRILEFCFMPEPRQDAITMLLALPLTGADEELLCHNIINPPTGIQLSGIAHAQALDVLLVRRINSGQYFEAIQLNQRISATIGLPHLSREVQTDADRARLRLLRAKREGLIKSASSVLTSVERQLLALKDSLDSVNLETPQRELEMSWEKVDDVKDQTGSQTPSRTPSVHASRSLTPLSASKGIRKEKGIETTSESFLSAVVQASPKRAVRVGELARSGTGSPLSRSLLLRSSSGPSSSLPRQEFESPRRTPSGNRLAKRFSSGPAHSPLGNGRPYQPPTLQTEQSENSMAMDEAGSSSGVYTRLAQQLQEQIEQSNEGDISLDSILMARSPFRTLQSTTKKGRDPVPGHDFFAKPARRFEAKYEIGDNSRVGLENTAGPSEGGGYNGDVQMDEVPRRRGARSTAKGAQRSSAPDAQVTAPDDSSLPGTFPAHDGENEVSKDETPQRSATQRRSTRRRARPQSMLSQDGEDEVPEMLATPTLKKSRSGAPLTRAKSAAKISSSTPVRRSARLSVEPESTPKVDSATPVKERRSRRATSKEPSLASASEKDDTESEGLQGTARPRRTRRSSKMPGAF